MFCLPDIRSRANNKLIYYYHYYFCGISFRVLPRTRHCGMGAKKLQTASFKICQMGQLALQNYTASAVGPRNIWGDLTDVTWSPLNVYKIIAIQKDARNHVVRIGSFDWINFYSNHPHGV